jgi:hypothetical protein
MIMRMTSRFDDHCVIFSDDNVGYGESVHRVLEKTRYPLFWIEDDYYWTKPYSMVNIVNSGYDYVALIMQGKRYRIGTTPAFWSRKVADWLLEKYPPPEQWRGMSEMHVKRCFIGSAMRASQILNIRPTDIGSQVYTDLHVHRCWPYKYGSWPLPGKKGK